MKYEELKSGLVVASDDKPVEQSQPVDRAASYNRNHCCCPRCGHNEIESTCVGSIAVDWDTYQDGNRANCRCGWRGIVHDLISKESAAKVKSPLPFDNFECDNCGACCKSLIVEAHDYDARREPKLYQIGTADRAKLRSGDHCIILYDLETRACPFLVTDGDRGDKHVCSIYETRPVACVMVEPGDAKCQQARRMKDLPLLKDRSGNEPSRSVLEASCEEYELDLVEVFGDEK